jgi:hypothetical protein
MFRQRRTELDVQAAAETGHSNRAFSRQHLSIGGSLDPPDSQNTVRQRRKNLPAVGDDLETLFSEVEQGEAFMVIPDPERGLSNGLAVLGRPNHVARCGAGRNDPVVTFSEPSA